MENGQRTQSIARASFNGGIKNSYWSLPNSDQTSTTPHSFVNAPAARTQCSRLPSRIRSHQVGDADAHAPRIHVCISQPFRLCECNAGYDAGITVASVDVSDIMPQAPSRSAGNTCRPGMGIARPCTEGVLTHLCVCFGARGSPSEVTARREDAAVANAHILEIKYVRWRRVWRRMCLRRRWFVSASGLADMVGMADRRADICSRMWSIEHGVNARRTFGASLKTRNIIGRPWPNPDFSL